MSIAVWPSLLLGLAAWGVAVWRAVVLNLHAAVDVVPLAAALEQRLGSGDRAGALALCHKLARAWAADVAAAALHAEAVDVGSVLEDKRDAYRQRAQLGLGVLSALSRMAFPLALGGAIAALSAALADASETPQVERALGSALQCMTVGVLTSVFCRVSAEQLRKQATRRMQEIAAVARVLVP